jgi:hypothetical protein
MIYIWHSISIDPEKRVDTISLIGSSLWGYCRQTTKDYLSTPWQTPVRDLLEKSEPDYCYSTLDPNFGVGLTRVCLEVRIPYILICSMKEQWYFKHSKKSHLKEAARLAAKAKRIIYVDLPIAPFCTNTNGLVAIDKKERGRLLFIHRNKIMIEKADLTIMIHPGQQAPYTVDHQTSTIMYDTKKSYFIEILDEVKQ